LPKLLLALARSSTTTRTHGFDERTLALGPKR
jgi:hypothetical protein